MRRNLTILGLCFAVALAAGAQDGFDPYGVLGVSRSANAADIRRAYRKLSKEKHPDKVRGAGGSDAELKVAEEQFQQIARAYEILSDDAARESFNIGAFQTQWEYEQWQKKNGRAGVKSKGLFQADGPVIALRDRAALHALVRDRSKPILLMFYASWCTHCQHFAPEYRKVALELDDAAVVAAFDCEQDEQVCMQEQVPGYPTLRLLTPAPDANVETWSGPLNRAEDVVAWAKEATSSEVVKLDAGTFDRQVMKSDDVWLVDFSAGEWCGPCAGLKGTLRRVAAQLSGRVKVGIVNCDANQHLCSEFRIGMYPYIKVFPRTTAEKLRYNNGLGEDVFLSQEHLQFPPAGALEIAAKVLKVVMPEQRPQLASSKPTDAHSHDEV